MEPTLFQHGMDWELFFSTFVLIFLAELPDKTAFAVLIMSSQRHPLGVYLGVCGAYLVQNLIAILAGSLLTLLPHRVVHVGAGILFLGFAVWMWFRGEEKEGKAKLKAKDHFWKTVWSAFLVIFIAEWGDLTQLATATRVAASGHPATVFLASTSAPFLFTERWPSGRRRTPGKRVGSKRVSRVRIPFSPPLFSFPKLP